MLVRVIDKWLNMSLKEDRTALMLPESPNYFPVDEVWQNDGCHGFNNET